MMCREAGLSLFSNKFLIFQIAVADPVNSMPVNSVVIDTRKIVLSFSPLIDWEQVGGGAVGGDSNASGFSCSFDVRGVVLTVGVC
jgi:hypothetical protein